LLPSGSGERYLSLPPILQMKRNIIVNTTIEVEMTAQDVYAYVTEKKLAPLDWKYFSVELVGQGVSKGAKLFIRHTEAKSNL
jgi:hypothetical protein